MQAQLNNKMPGVFVVRFGNGVSKLIHLRNVCAVSLKHNTVTFQYNFPCVTGDTYYEKVESHPAYETIQMPSETDAEAVFEKVQKEFERLE